MKSHHQWLRNTRALGWTVLAISLTPAWASAQKFSDWSAPVNLGPVINSGLNNQHPAISKDGLSLYYSSDRIGTLGGLDIWVSQRASTDEPWGGPQNLGPNINSSGRDLAPAFSPDGHFLYFQSDRPGGCGPAGTLDLYVSHRRDKHDDFGWEPALHIPCGNINTPGDDAGALIFNDEEHDQIILYFTRNLTPANPDGFDIYIATKSEDDEDPTAIGPAVLVPELSSPFRDTRMAIRRDGLEMILSSGRLGSVGPTRNEDLWVSTRESSDDPWGAPVNLGPVVNSPFFDGAPALSHDGTTLYFFSERPGGFGKRDLYVATRTKLKHEHRDKDDDDSKKE
jgi:hypothetical protein